MEAALAGGLHHIVQDLVGRTDAPRVDEDLRIYQRFTTLHLAARYGQHEMLTQMLGPGVNINKTALQNWTPLYIAVLAKRVACAEVLLRNGACLHARFDRDNNRSTELHLSILQGNSEMVLLLLRYGADVFATDGAVGHSVLDSASSNLDQDRVGDYKLLSAAAVWELVRQVALLGGVAPRKVAAQLSAGVEERHSGFDLTVSVATEQEEFIRNAENAPRQWRELMAMARRHQSIVTSE